PCFAKQVKNGEEKLYQRTKTWKFNVRVARYRLMDDVLECVLRRHIERRVRPGQFVGDIHHHVTHDGIIRTRRKQEKMIGIQLMENDLFWVGWFDAVGAQIIANGFNAKPAHAFCYDFAVLRHDHEVEVEHVPAAVPAIQSGLLGDSLRADELDISI